MIKWDLSQGCQDGLLSKTQTMGYTTLTNWRIKSQDHLNRCRKSFWQNSASIYDLKKLINKQLSTSRYRKNISLLNQIRSDQSLSRVRLFATPWIAARQASLSITNSRSSLRLTSIDSVMPSSHLIFCRPLLLLPPIPPSIRVFSNESTLRMRWPKYWSFSFSIIPSKEIPGLISWCSSWF